MRVERLAKAFLMVGFGVAGCALVYDFSGYRGASDAGIDGSGVEDGNVMDEGSGPDGGVAESGGDSAPCMPGDSHNCGRCGHDCLGGQCVAAQCTPVSIATNQSKPYGLAIGDAGLFWTLDISSGGVEFGSPDGGAVPFASGQNSPQGIALSAGYVYWTTTTEVVRCPSNTVCGSPESVASGEALPVHIAASNFIYWTVLGALLDAGDDATVGTGLVMRTNPVAPQDASVIASAQLRPNGIAANLQNIYWVDKGTTYTNGTLWRAGLDGSNATAMATGLTYPQRIALDGQSVYWTNFGLSGAGNGGSVMGCPLAGCNGMPTTLATNQGGPVGIAVDGANVYWAASNDGTISYCPKPACAGGPVVLANALQTPQALVQDSVSLYWTEWVLGGSVMRLAKP